MRKRTKITMDPKYILMTIAIVSVALIIVSFRFQDKMTPIRTAVGSVVTPMQRGINKIGLVVADGMDYVTTVKKLVKKNNALRSSWMICHSRIVCFSRTNMIWMISASSIVWMRSIPTIRRWRHMLSAVMATGLTALSSTRVPRTV